MICENGLANQGGPSDKANPLLWGTQGDDLPVADHHGADVAGEPKVPLRTREGRA